MFDQAENRLQTSKPMLRRAAQAVGDGRPDATRIVTDSDRASVAAQALSPWADRTASPYLCLQPGTTSTLDVAFTYTNIPAGQFTFTGPAAQSANHVLHLNVRDNDFYQRGIPGVTGSVDQTATWLTALRREIGATRMRMIGASMGAYAALMYGDMLDADAICAFSPILKPGHLALGQRSRFLDVSPLLPRLLGRTVFTFGAFDLGEYQYLLPCLQAGLRLADVAFLANFHPGLMSIDLTRLFAAADPLPASALLRTAHSSGLDAADVALLAGVPDVLGRHDHAGAATILGVLTRRDAANAGLLYRLGVHQVLAGWHAAALVSLRHALALLDAIGADTLGADADLTLRSTRDYARLLGSGPLQIVHAAIDAAGRQPPG